MNSKPINVTGLPGNGQAPSCRGGQENCNTKEPSSWAKRRTSHSPDDEILRSSQDDNNTQDIRDFFCW